MPGASLTGFVALAGDQHHVSGIRPGHRVVDRLATVADLDDVRSGVGFGCAGKDLAADRRWILAAGVVVGHHHQIGQLGGDAAHRRTFTRIAIAAGAEHHRQPAGRAAQGPQNLLQRARLVRIVDQGQEVLAAVDPLEPSGNLGVPQSS